jgi:tRNA-dihydrouridine synthase 1
MPPTAVRYLGTAGRISRINLTKSHRFLRKYHTCTVHSMSNYANAAADVPHAEAAWEWFNSLGAPKLWIAPMVDQSELPFRLLCRKYGATAAYTPMLHARLFLEGAPYRAEHFSTCPEDRPLLAQFCANDPDILINAAKIVAPHVDGIDLNLGCPQRIARRGRYGAYLMDDLPLVEKLVRKLASELSIPVTVKIRRFESIDRTVQYAAMLERAGASMLAIHGRTRDQKKNVNTRADWTTMAAVKKALRIPVLANGNIRNIHDVEPCLVATGADGVLSAESLLEDPAMFSPQRYLPGGEWTPLDGPKILLEYLDLVEQYPVAYRMIKGHAFKLLGPWLTEFIDLREELNRGANVIDAATLRFFTHELIKRIDETGRSYPIPKLSAKKLAAMEAESARESAIAEQEREEQALKILGVEQQPQLQQPQQANEDKEQKVLSALVV